MMRTFYSQREAKKKARNAKIYLVFAIFGAVFAVISLILIIVFSTYEERTLFMVMGSVLTSVFSIISLFFFLKRKFEKDNLFLYEQVLNGEGSTIRGKVVSISPYPITLSDTSYVYELVIEGEKRQETFYLPFEADELPKEGHEYLFEVMTDRVRGYEDI